MAEAIGLDSEALNALAHSTARGALTIRARAIARVADLTREIAQTAGALLAKARLSSAHAIDAFVVVTALDFDAAVIASGDAKDIKRLSAPYPSFH